MIRRVPYREILDAPNAPALLAEYAAECSLPELGAANPQAATYAAMERTGAFQCFGVFAGGALVGFASVLVYVNPHHNRTIATVESVFVAASDRSATAWLELKKALKAHAKNQNCAVLLVCAPVGSRMARLMALEKDEWRHSNQVFVTRLL